MKNDRLLKQKKDPHATLFLVVIWWILFAAMLAITLYDLCAKKLPISAGSIVGVAGILAVAVYFTVKFAKDKKNKKRKTEDT